MLSVFTNIMDFFNQLIQNPADYAFYIAIAAVIVLLIVVFIVSMAANKSKKKKMAKLAAQNSNQVTEEPVAEEAVEEQVVEQAVEEVLEEPVAEEAVEEPVVEQAVEEPVAEEAVEEPAVEEAVEEPVAEEAVEEPAVEEVVEEPVVEQAVEEPVAEEVVEEPVVEQVVEDKPVVEVAKAKSSAKKKTTKSAEVVEEKSAPKGRTYNGKYEVYPNGDGYQYCLKASNGEILIVSETYASRDGVFKAIDAVKRNVETGEVRIIEDKHGMFKFKLTSKNYRVIALGSNYSTEKSAVRASESFKKFALKADIVEIEAPADQDAGSSTVIELNGVEDKSGGKFIIEKYNGEFSWDLKASNGQILCQAEGYTSRVGVMNSIENFKKNAEGGVFKVVRDKNDNFHYKLYSPSGRVVAIGEAYGSKQLAESAAASAASYYKNAEIVDNSDVKVKK